MMRRIDYSIRLIFIWRRTMTRHYESDKQINETVKGLESRTTDKTQFKHKQHLAVAVAYLQTMGMDEAIAQMRTTLLAFLDHHGVSVEKYNQTVTQFWFEQVALRLAETTPDASLVDKCNYVIESLQNASLIEEFYSRELLFSARAREEFVSPDLRQWSK
jgi:hypothetical protein